MVATAQIVSPADDVQSQFHTTFWHSLIPEREAAEFLGISAKTVESYRWRGGGPPFIRVGWRCVRYRRADLKAWADTRLRCSTADDRENA